MGYNTDPTDNLPLTVEKNSRFRSGSKLTNWLKLLGVQACTAKSAEPQQFRCTLFYIIHVVL